MSSVVDLLSLAVAHAPTDVTTPAKVLNLPGPVEAVATVTGALSGALHASRKGLDIMGLLAVAICTGVGGGAIRDVILNSGIPVFLASPTLLMFALIAALAGALAAGVFTQFTPMMRVIDTLLIGVWVVIGLQRSLLLGLGWLAAMFVGVVACIGGGLLRDILCRDTPEVLRPGTFYAAAALVGATGYLVLAAAGAPTWASITAAMVLSSGLRVASAYFGWETAAATPPPEPEASALST